DCRVNSCARSYKKTSGIHEYSRSLLIPSYYHACHAFQSDAGITYNSQKNKSLYGVRGAFAAIRRERLICFPSRVLVETAWFPRRMLASISKEMRSDRS